MAGIGLRWADYFS